jgi:hypothetical protein
MSSHCRHVQTSLTVVHPMVGETERASHTEIRTLPTGAEFLETIGFAINMLCIPRSFSANICLMKVEDIYEHPMIKGGSRFHPGQ